MVIRVQEAAFELGAELDAMRAGRTDMGAIVSFLGTVRDLHDGLSVHALTLEHYPGMTEAALAEIVEQAYERWRLLDVRVIHRVGRLLPSDPIVLVAVSSAHRGDAFAACEFVMDWLKTKAPFWKKEETSAGTRWVEARATDDEAAARWELGSGV
jgi:molybdopterin synthase catalytic subunit